MIEDMQTGMMQQTAISAASLSQISRRTTSGTTNSQLDCEKSRNYNLGAAGRQPNRRPGKFQKQNFPNKREPSSRNIKKVSQDIMKGSKGAQKRNAVVESASAEHLLNFHYTSLRGNSNFGSSGVHGTRRRRTTFNKESFLQANCKFVVDSDEEKYLVHTIDPDVLVEWNAIQLVYLPTHETPKCPICLYPPTAAKMTRCGHVYCWSCVLHYLSLSDKTWHKCPICHEAVHERDLKSVIPIMQSKFSRHDDITMKLMRRSKSSLYACSDTEWEPTNAQFPVWEGQLLNSSSKLMLANKEAVFKNILMKEKVELSAQLSEALQEKSGEEWFIQKALQELEVKISSYSLLKTTVMEELDKVEQEISQNAYGDESNLSILLSTHDVENVKAFSDNEGDETLTEAMETQYGDTAPVEVDDKGDVVNLLEEPYARKERISESSSSDSSSIGSGELHVEAIRDKDSYFFYQAEDGQNIFINSLNARCLIEEYGKLENGPDKIVGQILDFESYTMTKELRKRFRYLSHLPISCEFIICELMLRPPVLSKHTIHNFMPEFKKRKAHRMKKMEEQRKFDMKANAEINREAGYRVMSYEDPDSVHLDLSDMTNFPSNLSPEDVDNQDTATKESASSKGPSFASMLKAESTPPTGAWGRPRVENKQTVTDATVYTRSFRQLPKDVDTDDDAGPNVVAPTLREMFSAAMITQSLEQSNESQSGKGGKGKKKKNKGTLLFATGAQRKY